jgi:hypothetical protein
MPTETGQEDDAAPDPREPALVASKAAPAVAVSAENAPRAQKDVAADLGAEPFLIADAPAAAPVDHDIEARLASAPDSRILLRFPALKSRFAPIERLIAPYRARLLRALDRQAARPLRRRRFAIGASVVFNIALLAVIFVFGRVIIRAPDRPVDSMSVVYVDLPEPPPLPELRDPEVAPPEPLIEPEPVRDPPPEPKPEPEPAPPEPEPEPEAEPEPEPQPPEPEAEPEPEPLLPSLTQEPQFLPPAEEKAPEPFIPEPAPAPEPEPQEPAPAEPQPIEPGPAQETPVAEASEPEEEEQKKEEKTAADAAPPTPGPQSPAPEALAVEDRKPAQNDDAYDEDPFAPRAALPQVDLPEGETSSAPGQSGVMAIFCPDEFKDKEKAAECAGRPEIRSGWKPGGSGEDFSRAVDLLKQQRERGDYSAGKFGTEAQRRAEELQKQLELNDFRKSQDDINNLGLESNDPAAGTRPDIGPAAVEPSWTRRDDPQVDQKDINQLKKELDAAADAKAKASDD